ncbi:MAG: bifunctional nicotinamidase/pyrazinamidase [Proteobacteria bacterium]|nr:bifunctional nicotinamidase/pyrazinamidase [Pseudomonadota bacterium]
MRALILVDLQYDFCPGGALEVADGDATIAVANRLIPRFPIVVATQDFHPADHGSFAVNRPGATVGQLGELGGLPQVMWPVHCMQGTPGVELHAALDRARITRIFQKGTDPAVDSYSGFFDNGQRKSTGLGEWLRAQHVDEVVVLGLATDYCVKATTLDALALGFRATLVTDGCRAVELAPGDGVAAVAAMRAAGATITTSAEL